MTQRNGTQAPDHVRLADVVKRPGSVDLNGKTFTVRPVNAPILQALADAEPQEGQPRITAFYDVAAMLVPDAPRADIDDLAPEQVAVIIAMGTRNVERLRELIAAEAPAPEEGAENEPRPQTATA